MRAPLVAYPAIEAHGIIGDRRTAALVAADGTIDWMCAPDYDGEVVFGALLDVAKGGHWRIGPEGRMQGRQRYAGDTFTLKTRWRLPEGELELLDAMAWPETARDEEHRDLRVVLRRLRATAGRVRCRFDFVPRLGLGAALAFERRDEHELSVRGLPGGGRLWLSRPVEAREGEVDFDFELSRGDELWAVLELGEGTRAWSIERARKLARATSRYWTDRAQTIAYTGPGKRQIVRSAQAVHLLGYAPQGSLIAAPTTSLPQGTWNADYRFAWVRDASLSLAILAMLGDSGEAERYMNWLVTLESAGDSPLQVLYGIRGELEASPRELPAAEGYRGARPVRMGNQAHRQFQLDSLGYLADCALVYLENGGRWRLEHWDMVRRAVSYTAEKWQQPDFGIWELATAQHYVSSKVMAWVAVDRGIRIARHLGVEAPLNHWRSAMDQIHADVLEHGWSERRQAFKQRYESDNLDASALLIPVMGFLPADESRVISTLAAVERELAIDGLVHRFVPAEAPGDLSHLPLGVYEGAFLPCTFWLATSYAKAGQPDRAEAILRCAEKVAGEPGLFAEGIDARTRSFTGNTPLLFSQVEYVRAKVETAKARPVDMLRMIPGKIGAKLHAVSR